MGYVYCPPDLQPVIEAWVANRVDDPWDRGTDLSMESLPSRGEDELSYLAFLCDVNAARPELSFSDEGLARVAVFRRIRDLAIQAGGQKPNVIRGGEFGLN
ncbi:hypothetical protein [Rhizocola hellebori]|uniref:hypothetical protein n=1 Tax=Rhizocola hellebori TaxID=1392758 RepID=UPI0019417678|nr:hypothetical protein [Rhizocola hellebori]